MIVFHPQATPPTYECLYEEAARQQLPPVLVLAVLSEEGGKLGMFSENKATRNKKTSWDIGPGQVNTWWLPKIAKLANKTEVEVASALAFDGCFNIAASTWILRDAINQANGDIWRGVGIYNSPTPAIAAAYSQRVQQRLIRIQNTIDRQTSKPMRTNLMPTTRSSLPLSQPARASAPRVQNSHPAGESRIWFIEQPAQSNTSINTD